MQALLLLLAAIVVGFFIGRSNWGKNIETSAGNLKDSASDRWRGWFGRSGSTEPTETSVEEESTEA